VRFDPSIVAVGPFPTDFLTVRDSSQKTGLRMNIPLPNCDVEPSTCKEWNLINQLDGFNVFPKVHITFSAPINPDTLRLGVYLVAMANLTNEEVGLHQVGSVSPINQVIYDPATMTAYAKPDQFLDQHRRYALIVTDAVLDTKGDKVESDPAFTSCVS